MSTLVVVAGATTAFAVGSGPAGAQAPRICGNPFDPRSVTLAVSGETPATILGPIRLISRNAAGRSGNGASGSPAPSADGRYVAFHSAASNLAPGDVNGSRDVFVRDRRTGVTELVSVSSTGAQGNGNSSSPWLSGDGRFVLFISAASSLVAGDTNDKLDAFVRDRMLGTTVRVSVGSTGQEANADTLSTRISVDGSVVIFATAAGNLTPGDTNGELDVFVHELASGTTTRPMVSNLSEEPNGPSHPGSLSADGSLIAFRSHASNLVAGDTNGQADAFVYDRVRGQTGRVNLGRRGAQANKTTYRPMLTSNGRFVVFRTLADNLVQGDTNRQIDVFVRDRVARTTRRINLGSGGRQANGLTARATISGSGRYVAFASLASNLVRGDGNRDWDVFLRDRWRGRTTMVSRAPGGRSANSCSKVPRLSADGHTVVFKSLASNLVAGDLNRLDDVFARAVGVRP